MDTLCLLAQPKEGQQQFKNKKQPELTENRTVWKSENQGDKEETFIHTGRRGGDGQLGRRGLTARQWLVDQVRWQIVEHQWQGCSWPAGQQLADPATDHTTQSRALGNKASPLIENTSGGRGSSRRNSQPHRRVCWRDP